MTCSVNACGRPLHCRGWCRMHYKRWQRHGNPERTLIAPKGARLATLHELVRVETGECVLWPFTPTGNGYGNVTINNRAVSAHVYVCEMFHGERPAGQQVLHSCDVRRCINPHHLSWGTQSENMRQMVERGRDRWAKRKGRWVLARDVDVS